MQKTERMTETLAHRYSSKSTWRELSNEYQHGRVEMGLKNLCALDESNLIIGRFKSLVFATSRV